MTLAVGVDLGGTRLRAALVDTAADVPSLLAEERFEVGELWEPGEPSDAPTFQALLEAAARRGVQHATPGPRTPPVPG